MSSSNNSDESSCEGDISVQEFKRSELLSFCNHLIDEDLLIISNRNLHLQAIIKEFLEFSKFITRPLNRDPFLVFLKPVFQHLYLLIRSHSGKIDAQSFVTYFETYFRLLKTTIPTDVFYICDHPCGHQCEKCDTCDKLQILINKGRIRVSLSSLAYHTLMDWLKDCFSTPLEMFTILRVLHENFHVDIYYDKDDEDFAAVVSEVLEENEKWRADYNALKAQEKSGAKVLSATCKTPQSDDDVLAQNMSELKIKTESPKMPGTPTTSESLDVLAQKMSEVMIKTETPKTPGTPTTSESLGGKRKVELKSSDFKLRENARRYLEKVRNTGWDVEKMWEALENHPPDFNLDNIPDNDQKMDFFDDPEPMADENAVMEIIEQLLVDPEEDNPEEGPEVSSPFEPKSVSTEDSVYVICSGSSDDSERNYDDDSHMPENLDDQDLGNVTIEGAKNKECQDNQFNQSYKTSFHSAYPLTIYGKDVLCSSDVSPDMLYLACGFESHKICTWRLCGSDVTGVVDIKLEPLGTLREHKGIVYALSIDSKRKKLISGSQDTTVKIWDIEKSVCVCTLEAHSAPVYAVCVSPNSRYFLSASEDKHVVLFCYDEVLPVRVYVGHSMEAINCVQFHPNCCYFASASSDGNVFLFQINVESCPVRMFSKHESEVYTLSFSPCGKYLASADVEGILIIWNILTYTAMKTIETGQGIRSISYDTSGSLIAALFYFHSWKVYSVEDDKENAIIEAESVAVPNSVHFSAENKMFIVQYFEADRSEIAEAIEKPKTKITMVDKKSTEKN